MIVEKEIIWADLGVAVLLKYIAVQTVTDEMILTMWVYDEETGEYSQFKGKMINPYLLNHDQFLGELVAREYMRWSEVGHH